jgi:hypothetical protein
MSNADFLGRAIETVKKAIETDTAGEYEKAYQMYYSARECAKKPGYNCILTWHSGAVHARSQVYVYHLPNRRVHTYEHQDNVLTTTRGEEPEVQGYDPGQGRRIHGAGREAQTALEPER